MSYDNAYKKSPNLWGNKPSNLITIFENKFEANSNCLDLGSGQGRDAIYLAGKGFKVTAIDSSDVAINQLNQKIKKEEITNLESVCSDVLSFEIIQEKYQVIIIINTLQFLPREKCLKLITNIKNKIALNGFVVIKAFTTSDSSFIRNRDNTNNTFFTPNELKDLFDDFKVLHHFEFIALDPGHGDKPEPHLHGIVELVAQRTK